MPAVAIPTTIAALPKRRLFVGSAAVAYSAAWLAGLAVPVPSVDLDAPAAAVLDGVAGHEAAVAVRSLLVHGVAAVALVVVAAALAGWLRRNGAERLATVARATGLAAAGLSIAQVVMELALAGPVAHGGDAAAADTITGMVNRVDGVKMLALAAFVGAGALAAGHGAASRRLGALGVVLVPALVVSGIGYAALSTALAPAAFVSLPLLLAWVTGAGIAAARS